MRPTRSAVTCALILAGAAPVASAQGQPAQPASPASPPSQQYPPLEVGAVAPDFALPGATRFGLLRDSVRLSDYRGKTVVLAFFFRARTRG